MPANKKARKARLSFRKYNRAGYRYELSITDADTQLTTTVFLMREEIEMLIEHLSIALDDEIDTVGLAIICFYKSIDEGNDHE